MTLAAKRASPRKVLASGGAAFRGHCFASGGFSVWPVVVSLPVVAKVVIPPETALEVERQAGREGRNYQAARKQLGPKHLLAHLMPSPLVVKYRQKAPHSTTGGSPEAETLVDRATSRTSGNLPVLMPELHQGIGRWS